MAIFEAQRFHNRTLELDGHTYRQCHFINCQLRFRGIAPFGFENNRIEGAFWLHLIDNWRSMPDALEPIRAELRRYGAALDEVLTPSEQREGPGWRPVFLPGQREMHIEYWFQREGKPGGGLRLIEPRNDEKG